MEKKDPTIPKLKKGRLKSSMFAKKQQSVMLELINCHTADLVKIASDNNVHVTQGDATALSRWRKRSDYSETSRRIGKTIVDCKEQIIAHVRANPNCHTADLVKIV